MGVVQFAAHAGALAALSGEGPHGAALARHRGDEGGRVAVGEGGGRRGQVVRAAPDEDGTVVEGGACGGQRAADVGGVEAGPAVAGAIANGWRGTAG
ncbi:hypothetical protein AB0I77_50920, partial [Streptomyces sp. NPDC050619]